MTPEQETQRFVATGDYDILYRPWPGNDIFESANLAQRTLRAALIDNVRLRAKAHGQDLPSLPVVFDARRFVLRKVGPMANGLFSARERQAILNLFEEALVFVTHDSIEPLLSKIQCLSLAWHIANLYLGSLGQPGLDGKPVEFVGLSEETTFYVSMRYFEYKDPFADWVVHEAAHVFHNWKRHRAGLPYTRRREFLLDIAFAKREEFAFLCEAYARILEQRKGHADGRRLHAEYAAKWAPSYDGVDRSELVDILAEAVEARNGWKCILRRCSPAKRE